MQPQASMRNGGIKRLGGLVVLIGVVALGRIGWGAQEDNYTIRDPDATVQGQQQAMEAELSQGHADEAAVRIDALFRDHGAEMQQDAAGVLVNVSEQWIELAHKSPSLTESYQKQFDPAARKALERIQANPRAGVADCMAVVRRYPLSSVVGDCVAEAARREAMLGDWSGGLDLFAAARADGWKDQDSDARLLAELAAMKKQSESVYSGPIPFDATWYGSTTVPPRSFPIAVGGQVVVAGMNDVFALRSGGTVGWSAALAQPPDDEEAFNPYTPQIGVNRGGLRGGFGAGGGGGFGGNGLGPEVSAPKAGSGRDEESNDQSVRVSAYVGALPAGGATTQPDSDAVSSGIIIIREADADQKNNGWALTALRTTDGKQLWSTRGRDDDNNAIVPPTVPDASFFRSPVVAGRYVYDMAVDIGAQLGGVSVVALDVATGKLVWRTPVGSLAPQSGNVGIGGGFGFGGGFGRGGVGGRGGRAGQVQMLAHLSYNSSIAVSGRRLVLTPDLGVAMCLDRFDGRLDWEEPTSSPPAVRVDADGNLMYSQATQRFDATAHVCGDVVILAPQDNDTPDVRGVSAITGQVIWQKTDMPAETLIGGDATRAIFAGKTITALDGATGNVLWKASDRLGDGGAAVAITGPSVVVGDQVQVPVSGDVMALSVATGETVKADASVPRMTPWLKNDATLQRLRDGKASSTFDKSPPRDDPPPNVLPPDIMPIPLPILP